MFTRIRFLILGATILVANQPDEVWSRPPLRTTQDPAASAPTLKPGDTGPAVEALQLTLNADPILKAQPNATPLDVDGDYGNATRVAVERFQRLHKLPTTGFADPATRAAMGPPPPLTAEPPVPAPEIINAQVTPRKPAEPLDGPPATLSPVWAIADGKTGALIQGENADRPVEIASTTKIMTALIVTRFASRDPKVLDEVVTFSERADRTPGSTSGLKAGETAPVGELLYGLLLPSGNDAATAFAEHFGARCAPPEGDLAADLPLPRFVAEMNRVAAELGMAETHFDNPHGLPVATHRASARDLARLASVALRDPTFARVVNTPRHGFTTTNADGQKRNVVWSNTNRLLGTEGYDGVKTGTTTAAGNCLVASGHRGQRPSHRRHPRGGDDRGPLCRRPQPLPLRLDSPGRRQGPLTVNGSAHRLLDRPDEVGALALGLEFGCSGFGEGFVRIVEGLNRPAADVADRPDDAHPGGRFGANPPLGGLGSGFPDGRLVQAQGFGRFGGGPQVAEVERAAGHRRLQKGSGGQAGRNRLE